MELNEQKKSPTEPEKLAKEQAVDQKVEEEKRGAAAACEKGDEKKEDGASSEKPKKGVCDEKAVDGNKPFLKVEHDESQVKLSLRDRQRAVLFGLYVADAVAMPVHWMYDLRNLKRDYGEIKGYRKPLDKFRGSILNLSNTGGGGRGSDEGDIVGRVILHGKKKYWGRGQNNHYHLGMAAGENTLEAQLTRLLTRQMTVDKEFNADNYRKAYMKFMQTPGSHNDTYAATAHRMFFKNLVNGKDPKLCPDNDYHNVDAIDALTVAIPVIVRYCLDDTRTRNAKVMEAIRVTRDVKQVQPYAFLLSDMLVRVMVKGEELRTVVLDVAYKLGLRNFKQMVEGSVQDPMTACYIDSSFPALLFFLYKYADSPEKAILANANAGGENVARGALVGALMGAHHGMSGFPNWMVDGLLASNEITDEIEQLLGIFNQGKEKL